MKHTKVAIIGSGPAGLTAAIYTARADLSPLVFGGEKYGGQLMLTTTVENFPGFPEGVLGPKLMMDMMKQAQKFGAEILFRSVTKVDFSQMPYKIFVDEDEYTADSVIIATGAKAKWLGLPNEMTMVGRGISTCATCDAAFYKGKKVAVVGGGDTAMEDSLFLTRFASEVHILHRKDTFRASQVMQKKVLENAKITVHWNSEVKEYMSSIPLPLEHPSYLDSLRFTGVKLHNNKTNEDSELEVNGIFLAVGYEPMSKVFEGQIDIDEKGYIKPIDGKIKTSKEGIYVCGDVEDHRYRQAIVASGAGCMSAMEAETYLREKE
ncbi:MAG: thioredoxin-disulfide reductase [bacterium]